MNTARKTSTTSAQAETVTRHVGNCQLCEGDFKLTADDKMVHHGYKRPGDGCIHGDCPAVNADPYEVSCDLIKSYVGSLRRQLVNVRRHLADLETGKVTYLTESHTTGWGHNRRLVTNEFALGVTELYIFDQTLRAAKASTEDTIRNLVNDIERCDKRIAAWMRKPIRTVEELAAAEQSVKDAARAVRAAAKAERDAKKAATRAKMDALEARRCAARDAFRARLGALMTQPTGAARDAAADKLYDDMLSKKGRKEANIWWLGDLHCPEMFAAVGLATLDPNPKTINGHGDRHAKFHRTNGTT